MTEPAPAASPAPGSPKDTDDRAIAVIVAGGEGLPHSMLGPLPARRTVYAADSGLDVAGAAGIDVDVVVGDLDSVSRTGLAAAELAGTTIERHPVDKDHTDLDLALSRAAADGFTSCVVLGGGGGGSATSWATPPWWLPTDTPTSTSSGSSTPPSGGSPARTPRRGAGPPGDLVSLLAVGDRATGVTTTGLRWRLLDDVLKGGSTRGISNERMGPSASVSVTGGALLVITEPAAAGDPS